MNSYLEKNAFTPPLFSETPSEDLSIVVVIPCFNEDRLIRSLESLLHASDSTIACEVIVIINNSVETSKEIVETNTATYEEALDWSKTHSTESLRFFIHYIDDMPVKHAGVGLARKIGMDEAVKRFDKIGKDGVIVCFDADSRCEPNYFSALHQHFYISHSDTTACSIHFEHPIDEENSEGIILYELHLRYFIEMQKWAGFPYAYHTIGSSMAVRSSIYQKQGGMNRRKAGEDFYFLHKIIPLGGFSELATTKVIPSPRTSDRVPFGTGKAMNDYLESDELLTYHPDAFIGLKSFCTIVHEFYAQEINVLLEGLPIEMERFLVENNLKKVIKNAQQNSASINIFTKRMYEWFTGFMVMKYVHYYRDNVKGNIEIKTAVDRLFELRHIEAKESKKEQLETLRLLQS